MKHEIIRKELEKLFGLNSEIQDKINGFVEFSLICLKHDMKKPDKHLFEVNYGEEVLAGDIQVLTELHSDTKYISDRFNDFCRDRDFEKIKILIKALTLLVQPIDYKSLKRINESIKESDKKTRQEIQILLKFYDDTENLVKEANKRLKEASLKTTYIGAKTDLIFEAYKYLKLADKLNKTTVNELLNKLIGLSKEYPYNSANLINISIEQGIELDGKTLERIGKFCVEKEKRRYALYCYAKLGDKNKVEELLGQANKEYKRKIKAGVYVI